MWIAGPQEGAVVRGWGGGHFLSLIPEVVLDIVSQAEVSYQASQHHPWAWSWGLGWHSGPWLPGGPCLHTSQFLLSSCCMWGSWREQNPFQRVADGAGLQDTPQAATGARIRGTVKSGRVPRDGGLDQAVARVGWGSLNVLGAGLTGPGDR